MEELLKKISQLLELSKAIKAIKPTNRPTIPQLPGLRPPSTPSMTPSAPSANKMPGINPNSKKDPRKIAEQIKDGSMSTKTQKNMLKVEENGQWNLVEKADKPISSKDPVLNYSKFAPKPLTPEKLKELQTKLETYNKNKTLKKDEVQSSSEKEE